MVSSKLDDVQDHFHHGLFATISQRVAFIRSHMLSISHSTGKIADHGSSISEVEYPNISFYGLVTEITKLTHDIIFSFHFFKERYLRHIWSPVQM